MVVYRGKIAKTFIVIHLHTHLLNVKSGVSFGEESVSVSVDKSSCFFV